MSNILALLHEWNNMNFDNVGTTEACNKITIKPISALTNKVH